MARRIFVLAAVAAFALTSFAAAAESESDRDCTRQEKLQQEATQTEVQVPTPAPVTLAEMFVAPVEEQSIETEDGVSAMVAQFEVVISRIGPDGKPIMACVDTLESARQFFAAPIENLPAKRAKEQ